MQHLCWSLARDVRFSNQVRKQLKSQNLHFNFNFFLILIFKSIPNKIHIFHLLEIVQPGQTHAHPLVGLLPNACGLRGDGTEKPNQKAAETEGRVCPLLSFVRDRSV